LGYNSQIANSIKHKIDDAYDMSKYREIVADTFKSVNKTKFTDNYNGKDKRGEKNHYVSISLIAENYEGN